jgi:hypothetical protein
LPRLITVPVTGELGLVSVRRPVRFMAGLCFRAGRFEMYGIRGERECYDDGECHCDANFLVSDRLLPGLFGDRLVR